MFPPTCGRLSAYQKGLDLTGRETLSFRRGFRLQNPDFLSMDGSLWPNPAPGNMATSHLQGLRRQNITCPSHTFHIPILPSVPNLGILRCGLSGTMACILLLLCLDSHSIQHLIQTLILWGSFQLRNLLNTSLLPFLALELWASYSTSPNLRFLSCEASKPQVFRF